MTTVTLNAHGHTARLDVDPGDHIGRVITRGRTWYEHDLLSDAFKRVHGPGTAVDVGAHIGNHALWFALAMGLNVVALEPNPATYPRLVANLQDNRVQARIIAAAAGSNPGWGSIIPARQGNSGTAGITFDGGDIPITTLDDLDLHDVRLVKIDVEGAAADVLAGAQRLLAEQSPVLYVEADPDELVDVLPVGYRCFGRFAKTPTWGFSK